MSYTRAHRHRLQSIHLQLVRRKIILVKRVFFLQLRQDPKAIKTCKQQEVIIDKIMQDSRFDKVRYYVVDFDNDKEGMRKLKANTRSTILIFKGKRELTRSANDTDPASIQNLLEKAL